ncbi:MAG TPA: hypothetical protein VIY51_17645 [Xanthobacteraceae bacterium]
MDKHEDGKAAGTPGTANDPVAPAAGEPTASEAAAEPAIELARIDSPTIAPANPGTDDAGVDAREAVKRRSLILAPVSPREEFKAFEAAAAAAGARASRSSRRFTLPTASVVLAVACGAAAGAAGIIGLEQIAPVLSPAAPAPAAENLPATIGQMRAEIAALKSSVDAESRGNTAQFTKLTDRFDRMERGQAATTSKADAAFPKETTGSVTLPSAAAAPLPVAPAPLPQSVVVPGWGVRDVYRGIALLQSRAGGMVEVEAGDVLPGLGRIDAIRRQDGHWVVITSRGTISSMR